MRGRVRLVELSPPGIAVEQYQRPLGDEVLAEGCVQELVRPAGVFGVLIGQGNVHEAESGHGLTRPPG